MRNTTTGELCGERLSRLDGLLRFSGTHRHGVPSFGQTQSQTAAQITRATDDSDR
jgi:hypothetical protein